MTKKYNSGSVELIDHIGDQFRILESARVSTGAMAIKGPDKDQKLIKYLWDHGHTSPFEQVSFTFNVKAPIFIARQVMRHRTFKFNEMSGRYREIPNDYYIPKGWRLQDTKNKQGSSGIHHASKEMTVDYITTCNSAIDRYKELLDCGVSREMARMVLPQSMYTEFFMTADLHNLLKFLEKRDHPDAQLEAQELAKAIKEIIFELPNMEYVREAING